MSLIPGAGRASGLSGFSNGTAVLPRRICWFRAMQESRGWLGEACRDVSRHITGTSTASNEPCRSPRP